MQNTHSVQNISSDKLLLDVPFLPDKDYIRFLDSVKESIWSLHFGLYSDLSPDARHRFESLDVKKLIGWLQQIPGPKKYALLNGRFCHPDFYFDKKRIQRLCRHIADMADSGVLNGIVVADAYQLIAMSEAGGHLCSGIEAVCSVNCQVDSFEKAHAWFDIVSSSKFAEPSYIVLDRSLNRNFTNLKTISQNLAAHHPKVSVVLLANEGCLYQCPFKPAHDAHISLSNMRVAPERTHEMNRNLGCFASYMHTPFKVLSSPFIRPEDTRLYRPWARAIKICGRNLGKTFLAQAIKAYAEESFSGNLLSLMESMEWISRRINVNNKKIPVDFARHVGSCNKACSCCNYCSSVLSQCQDQQEFVFRDLQGPISF